MNEKEDYGTLNFRMNNNDLVFFDSLSKKWTCATARSRTATVSSNGTVMYRDGKTKLGKISKTMDKKAALACAKLAYAHATKEEFVKSKHKAPTLVSTAVKGYPRP